jgi:hypothetical protein
MPGVVWQHYYLLMENDIHARMGFANFHMWTSHEMYICETFLKCPRTSTSSVSIIGGHYKDPRVDIERCLQCMGLEKPNSLFFKRKKIIGTGGI